MNTNRLVAYLMEPRNWWLPLLLIFTISISGWMMIGVETYTEAPPIADMISPDGRTIVRAADVTAGQIVFQNYALMDHGSMFGDGANRGPDYTAEALHLTAVAMREYHSARIDLSSNADEALMRDGISQRVQNEIKRNGYSVANNSITISESQTFAVQKVREHYIAVFTDASVKGAFRPASYITDTTELRRLADFFFWGAWACGAERPGETFSYTHNWPFDPDAGNTPTGPVILWSILGSLGLFIGLGLVLFFRGSMEKVSSDAYTANARPFLTDADVQRFQPQGIQRVAFWFLYVAIMLFGLQVFTGILTVHDFVGFVTFFGFDVSTVVPVTITRSWHVQLSLLWISACWIGGSLFVMNMLAPDQPRRQHTMVKVLLVLTLLLVGGMLVGVFMGPHGLLGSLNYWLGHQGWEYVELGKIWQILLAVVLALWAFTLFRGLRGIFVKGHPWSLPNWMVYSTISIVVLLMSGFIAQPETNFVIADFWRWCVIHMWAEAFFEVFTTVLIGYFMVLMGLVSKQAAIRVIYIATLLFLGSGLLGISHNFYWNGKPVATMALGSIFSTLQVIPLVLLTIEAWRFSHLPRLLEEGASSSPAQRFGFSEVFLFLVGVNFWNFFGAGVLGFIINLPIANYYEHGSYLTVNHGHAALMGVYGNLAIAAVLFCSKLMIAEDHWRPRLVRRAFWSINIGLLLMVLLDLFPVGIYQFSTIVNNGFWYARSSDFIEGTVFQSFTWMRIIGGSLFTLGGVLPLMWLMFRGQRGLK
ncbi:MAG: cbb3-type cytochrome c oxidase subunit I [Ignavibacteria bacterium]|nr:cbb3-type cytochrome c oxidase subunit I [Ignavibacteria bacterium]MBK6418922.1 cbb3-type cytochrome c oxidase subunit I [Ignavibacteria bacterium]